jgi:hypothetical protein
LCVQTVDLHGVLILTVETGSFKDMTLDPTSMSGSLAFFIISFSTDCLLMTLRCLIRCVNSSTENFFTM